MKLFTDFDFDRLPFPNDITDANKLEYIKAMIALAQNDKKAVFPYVIIALAVAAFVVNKYDILISVSSLTVKIIFYFGLLLLITSAVLYFSYWRKIHKCEIQLTNCIPTLNIQKAQSLWIGLWEDNKVLFKLGLLSLILGSLITVLVPVSLRIISSI